MSLARRQAGRHCNFFALSSLWLEHCGHNCVRPWPGRGLNHACLVSNASRGEAGLDLNSESAGLPLDAFSALSRRYFDMPA